MSDIDKIKKINEMSQALKEHGFAESSEEAASQAQDVFKEKIADVEKGGNEKMGETNDSDIAKVERNFEVFKSSTQQDISSLKDEVSGLIGKMNEMIKAINELEKLKNSVINIDEGDEKQQRLAPKVVKKQKEEKPQTHPRSGDAQPGDVDLSQTFYYGNK